MTILIARIFAWCKKALRWLERIPVLGWIVLILVTILWAVGRKTQSAVLVTKEKALVRRHKAISKELGRLEDLDKVKTAELLDAYTKKKKKVDSLRKKVQNSTDLSNDINAFFKTMLLFVLAGLLVALPALTAYAAPCVQTATVTEGGQVMCDGILWPEPWSRSALLCLQVDLPDARADTVHQKQVYDALVEGRDDRIRFLEQAARTPEFVEVPTVDWLWVGSAGVVGVLTGVLLINWLD